MALNFGRKALAIALFCCVFSGCSGGYGVVPSAATVSAPGGAASSISPSALRGALVYLAVNPEVSVYSYPGGKRAGTLDGISNPVALCSDTSGNVWVIDFDSRNRSTLLKYAHGGSEPIASLHLNGRGDACSVDPSTGNLAVGTLSSRIAVWTNGQGSPAMYSTHAFFHAVRTVAYDGNGNLYMRSFNRGEPAAWLPKGAPAAIEFHITKLGSYAWDGRYLVIGPANSYAGPLTRYKLHGGSGKVVGNVSVDDCAADYEPSFSIVDSDLVVSCGLDETNSLNYYRYPKGGKPITHFNAGASGSVAISVAPSEK